MSEGVVGLLVLAIGMAVVVGSILRRRRNAKRRREARELAARLVPEIRAILEDSETRAADTSYYAKSRSRLPHILSSETLFAVETFYQSAEALVSATAAMTDAFAAEGEASLGDRIRAKDLRDRLMKDVYYSGEAAIQKLEAAP